MSVPALFARRRGQGELAGAFGGPGECFLAAGLARGDLDPVGHHEGRVEADAELADQAGPVFRLRAAPGSARRRGCRSGRWCPGCRSFPAGSCRCRRPRSAGCWPACPARCGSWRPAGGPDWHRSAPRTGGDPPHPPRSPPVPAEISPARNRASAPPDRAGARPRRQMNVVPKQCRSCVTSLRRAICGRMRPISMRGRIFTARTTRQMLDVYREFHTGAAVRLRRPYQFEASDPRQRSGDGHRVADLGGLRSGGPRCRRMRCAG